MTLIQPLSHPVFLRAENAVYYCSSRRPFYVFKKLHQLTVSSQFPEELRALQEKHFVSLHLRLGNS